MTTNTEETSRSMNESALHEMMSVYEFLRDTGRDVKYSANEYEATIRLQVTKTKKIVLSASGFPKDIGTETPYALSAHIYAGKQCFQHFYYCKLEKIGHSRSSWGNDEMIAFGDLEMRMSKTNKDIVFKVGRYTNFYLQL